MTDERLAELEALCIDASPGPWEVETLSDNLVIVSRDGGGNGEYGIGHTDCCDGAVITGTNGPWQYRALPGPFGKPPLMNYRFMAMARTALPEALSEIRRLRKALDGYRRPISIPFITPKSKPDVVEVGRSSYSGVCSPEEEPSKGGS